MIRIPTQDPRPDCRPIRPIRCLCWGAALLAALSLPACGGGGDDDVRSTVAFKPDAASCAAGQWRMQMYIDGTLVGTETVTVGSSSTAFETTPGDHSLAVVLLPSGLRFGPSVHPVGENEAFTLHLVC